MESPADLLSCRPAGQCRPSTGIRAGVAGLTPACGPSLWPGLLHGWPLVPGSIPRGRAQRKRHPSLRPHLRRHTPASLGLQRAKLSPPRFMGRQGDVTSWEEGQHGRLWKAHPAPVPFTSIFTRCAVTSLFIRARKACLPWAPWEHTLPRDPLWAPSSLPSPHPQISRPWARLPCPLRLLTQ